MSVDMIMDLKLQLAKVAAKYPRHIRVIYLRFFANATLADVGAALGVSTDRARQIEVKALRLLRQELHRNRMHTLEMY
jgi:DNA-directed RNA polymerase sigma subunit (sigma70/sigma32)